MIEGKLLFWIFLILSSFTLANSQTKTKVPDYQTKYEFLNYTGSVGNDAADIIYYDYDTSRGTFSRDYEHHPNSLLDDNDGIEMEGEDDLLEQQRLIQTTPIPDIYPDPEQVYRKYLNKTESKRHENDENDDNVVKVYTFRKSSPSQEDATSFDRLNKDMKGHDFIDNIMYIYYGPNGTLRRDIGGNVIVIGAVFALAPQILTIIIAFLRNKRSRYRNAFFPICSNLLLMCCMSNLVFIVGAQSSKNTLKCEMVAIVLHYLHLSTSIWCLIFVYVIYDLIINDCGPNFKGNYLIGYGVPAIYVMFSYGASIDMFEMRKYCWMSIQKGMIVSFMVPISFLIITTTIFGTLSLKRISMKQNELICESIENMIENNAKCNDLFFHMSNHQKQHEMQHIELKEKCCDEYDDSCNIPVINYKKSNIEQYYEAKIDLRQMSMADLSSQSLSSEVQDYNDFKRATKFGLFFQPIFSICWFLGVIALENMNYSCVMAVIFSISFNILNWCMLVRSSNICPFINIPVNDDDDIMKESVRTLDGSNSCADTIPLLCSSTNGNNATSSSSTRKFSTTSEQEQQILNFIASSNFNYLDNTNNLDCISTISN